MNYQESGDVGFPFQVQRQGTGYSVKAGENIQTFLAL